MPRPRAIRPQALSYAALDAETPTVANPTLDMHPMMTEYTELSHARIDTSLFAVPAGFKVQDMRGMQLTGEDMGAMMSSMMKADSSCAKGRH